MDNLFKSGWHWLINKERKLWWRIWKDLVGWREEGFVLFWSWDKLCFRRLLGKRFRELLEMDCHYDC